MPRRIPLYESLLLIVFCSCRPDNYKVIHTDHERQATPALMNISPDSSHWQNTVNTSLGKHMVLLYFKPDCPFCQFEISEIAKHISAMHGARFYLVAADSSNTLQTVRAYLPRHYPPNLCIGIQYCKSFQHYFNPEVVPYTAIYHSNKTLSKTYLDTLSEQKLA